MITYKYCKRVSKKLAAELDQHRNRENSGMAAQLMYDLKRLKAAVAKDDKEIIGWVGFSLNAHNSEISLYVDPEYRKDGIGNELLDVLLVNLPKEVKNKPIDYQTGPRWVGKMYEKAFIRNGYL